MDLDHAIQKHAEWKMNFRKAITQQETMDTATIGKDDCCELGKWLHGEAKIKYGKLASHGNCMNKHASFHTEAKKVAVTINKKMYANAEAMLGLGTQYTNASTAVAIAITQLKKEAGL